MTMIRTDTSSESLLAPTNDCSIDGCYRAAAVALTQSHSLWVSPLRINVCASHQGALTKEAEAAGVTVAVEHRYW